MAELFCGKMCEAEAKELEAFKRIFTFVYFSGSFFQEATIGKATLMKGFIM